MSSEFRNSSTPCRWGVALSTKAFGFLPRSSEVRDKNDTCYLSPNGLQAEPLLGIRNGRSARRRRRRWRCSQAETWLGTFNEDPDPRTSGIPSRLRNAIKRQRSQQAGKAAPVPSIPDARQHILAASRTRIVDRPSISKRSRPRPAARRIAKGGPFGRIAATRRKSSARQ